MNFSDFVGQNANDVKAKLEELGFEVALINNSFKSAQNSKCLVVKVNLLNEKKIELICGDFTFLS